MKRFLNSWYSSIESKDFAREKVAVWLAGTLTTDTSKSSASFISNPSVSSLYSASLTLKPTEKAPRTPSLIKSFISPADLEILAPSSRPLSVISIEVALPIGLS